MNEQICNWCVYCDTKRQNKLGQARCKRFSTYVSITSSCDYFLSESTKNLIEALNNEKDIPKKPKIILKGTSDWNTKCICPNCRRLVFDRQKYCDCGQALDWGGEASND